MTLLGAGMFVGAATLVTMAHNKLTNPHSTLQRDVNAALEAAGLLDHTKRKHALPWRYRKIRKKENMWEIILQLPKTKTVFDVQQAQEKISLAFDCGVDIEQNGFGYIKIKIYKDPMFTDVPFDEEVLEISRTRWEVPVGKDRNGWAKWNFKSTPHLLFAGLTDTGKTALVVAIVACILLNHPETHFWFYDGKGDGDFNRFQHLPQTKQIALSGKEANQMFTRIMREMFKRSKLLRESDCKNINVYNDLFPDKPMNRMFVIIDEVAQLPKDVQKLLSRILQLGRSKGIHVMVGTQRPDRNVLNTQIKSQCDAIACFRVARQVDSRLVFDDEGAEELPGIKGRFIFIENGIRRILQAPYASDARLKLMFLKHNIKKQAKEIYVPLSDDVNPADEMDLEASLKQLEELDDELETSELEDEV